MNKRALITGISGQDGSYLSEHLLDQGFEVYGLIRRQSVAESQDIRIKDLDVKTYYGDLTDPYSLIPVFKEARPTHIFNLGAMSHVKVSFDVPAFTIQTNALGVLNMLEATRMFAPDAKFYQASSSEMFGNSIDTDGYQRETTPMIPVSPYGCAKLMGYNLTRHYREAYKLKTWNGILFNHESPRRGANFVTQKVIKGAVSIKKGLQSSLTLGNIDAQRDWGHSKDYTLAMIQMLEGSNPDDFVIATGQTRTIRNLCSFVFRALDMSYLDYVKFDNKYTRPEELDILKGDATKAFNGFGWTPSIAYSEMIMEMINYWMEEL